MKNLTNKKNKLSLIVASMGLLITLTSCTSYKTTWDCPKVKGIGCSSLEYADEIARKQILLNTDINNKKTILIKKDLSSDLTDKNNFEEEEIY